MWKTIHIFVGTTEYGKAGRWNGVSHQDFYVIRILRFKRNGFFVDLAAFDAVQYSNTHSLERNYGWDGICIEPLEQHFWGLAHRRCTVVAAVVTDRQHDTALFRVNPPDACPACSGVVGPLTDNANNIDAARGELRERPTVQLGDVLRQFGAPKDIDYLSLDVEGAEELVLEGFPFATHRARLVSVERPKARARALLHRHGYAFLRLNSPDGDEMWVHASLPWLAEAAALYGTPEPGERPY
jgi:hypothetical protein